VLPDVPPDVLPKVSIGLPVYNGQKYLAEALASLEKQTFNDFEVILCDNASTDDTEAICREVAGKDKRFKYHRNAENLGAARNFNRAFELARGEYFRWMGHDDRLDSNCLASCVRELDSAPSSVSLVFTGVRYIDKDGGEIDERRSRRIRGLAPDESLAGLTFSSLLRLPPSAAPIFVFGLMRASTLAKTRLIGNYIASDLVVNAELRLLGEFREIPAVLFEQRIHHREEQRAKRSTLQGEAEWFDPNAGTPLLLPGFRLCLEYLKGIQRLSLDPRASFTASLAVLGFVAARLFQFFHEVGFRIWSRVSVASVWSHRRWGFPLRVWLFLHGVRRGRLSLIKLAWGSAGGEPGLARLLFGALRLGRRLGWRAEQVVVGWVQFGDGDERVAAARGIELDATRYEMEYRRSSGDSSENGLANLLSDVARTGEPRKEELRKILAELDADPMLIERLQ